MRQVVPKCYCLPPEIIKWLDDMAKKKSKIQKRYISSSSILSDLLLDIKTNNK